MLRRQLLTRIVQGFTVTGLAALVYPFVKAWLPSFDADISLEVPVDRLAPGEAKLVRWLGRNVIIRRRSRDMLDTLGEVNPQLKDPRSVDSRQPEFARNEFRSLTPEFFVAYNNCTHLGCEVAATGGAGDTGEVGFKCPCHQSEYDHAGRVLADAAAPLNLEVPYYRFVSRNTLRLQLDTP